MQENCNNWVGMGIVVLMFKGLINNKVYLQKDVKAVSEDCKHESMFLSFQSNQHFIKKIFDVVIRMEVKCCPCVEINFVYCERIELCIERSFSLAAQPFWCIRKKLCEHIIHKRNSLIRNIYNSGYWSTQNIFWSYFRQKRFVGLIKTIELLQILLWVHHFSY